MHFFKTLLWVILAVILVVFASVNWDTPQNGIGKVTIQLWGGLMADVRLPILVLFVFLLGFLPTFLIYRARLWSLKRRLEERTHSHVANAPTTTVRNTPVETPPTDDEGAAGAAPAR